MKKIKLTQNKITLVDDTDFEYLNQWKWFYHKTNYALTRKENKEIRMHRIIMNCPENMEVDHINGNGLDNRRLNLRICTPKQNGQNRKINKNNKSGYKGVTWAKRHKKWQVYICVNGKNKFIGHYKELKNAANAYNQAAKKYYGRFAKVNKI